jgi:DNA replication and repair protein RecF
MQIHQLKIDGLRNLKHQTIDLSPSHKVSLFVGDNGSGKTSVLEAIHCLATGSTFRSTSIKQLISIDSEAYYLFAKSLDNPSDPSIAVGASRSKDGKADVRLSGEKIKSQEIISALLPVMVLEPGSFDLVIGSPDYRRKFLDWGVFHVKHEYWSLAARYRKAVKQRNALLRANANRSLVEPWTDQLVELASVITEYRQSYFNELKTEFESIVSQLTDLENVEMRYNRGWSKDQDYKDYLTANIEKDFEQGYTRYGPHRADIVIKSSGMSVKEVLSRGQLKLLVCALVLAQCRLFEGHGNKETILLLDDLAAELDEQHRNKVLSELITMGRQVFMTAVDTNGFSPDILSQTKVFHVKQGKITAG